MKPSYFILFVFLAMASQIQGSDDDISDRSVLSSRVALMESESFAHFQRGVQSVHGYAALAQKVGGRLEEVEIYNDRRVLSAFKTFQQALLNGNPRLYDELPLSFFEQMGRSVSQKWVIESAFSFDILKIWESLISSKEPEVMKFLRTHLIQEAGQIYIFVSDEECEPVLREVTQIKLDKVATHFPHNYRPYSFLQSCL